MAMIIGMIERWAVTVVLEWRLRIAYYLNRPDQGMLYLLSQHKWSVLVFAAPR